MNPGTGTLLPLKLMYKYFQKLLTYRTALVLMFRLGVFIIKYAEIIRKFLIGIESVRV